MSQIVTDENFSQDETLKPKKRRYKRKKAKIKKEGEENSKPNIKKEGKKGDLKPTDVISDSKPKKRKKRKYNKKRTTKPDLIIEESNDKTWEEFYNELDCVKTDVTLSDVDNTEDYDFTSPWEISSRTINILKIISIFGLSILALNYYFNH